MRDRVAASVELSREPWSSTLHFVSVKIRIAKNDRLPSLSYRIQQQKDPSVAAISVIVQKVLQSVQAAILSLQVYTLSSCAPIVVPNVPSTLFDPEYRVYPGTIPDLHHGSSYTIL